MASFIVNNAGRRAVCFVVAVACCCNMVVHVHQSASVTLTRCTLFVGQLHFYPCKATHDFDIEEGNFLLLVFDCRIGHDQYGVKMLAGTIRDAVNYSLRGALSKRSSLNSFKGIFGVLPSGRHKTRVHPSNSMISDFQVARRLDAFQKSETVSGLTFSRFPFVMRA
ncbi:hypothetical protein EVAR_35424_1 [Eumeta japonica]|uniref:Uncharacterized protein n=1 Tax=Eumeta variegata TaxID=151549 RepID=A0A4C1XAZ2_EUMVA|nr:hypothetical protein EVAR_35424_1 [Eumeta japonica]